MSTIFDRETTLKALRDAAWIAKHGTREEQSGRFLPPPGWQGRVVTATDDGLSEPKRGKAA
jgi:hypothetical protein